MRTIASLFAWCALAALSPPAQATAAAPNQPVRVIFDTDMFGDIDDVLALAMVHALQDRGEVKLLAVTSSTDDKWTASYIDALNGFYGHGDVPVGLVRNGVTAEATIRGFPQLASLANYTRHFAELRNARGERVYPHALIDGSKAQDAVMLLRKTLAAQPDDSVVMIMVGFSTNMARLLQSPADTLSPLTGRDLVKRKVRLLSAMAGWFADDDGKPLTEARPEFNLELDVPSARQLFALWPTPIVASGAEIGRSMKIRGADIERQFVDTGPHLVAETYRYFDPIFRMDTPAGQLHDHKSFDLTSVLYAVRPDDGYFSLSPSGRISVGQDGSSRFEPSGDSSHRYLVMDDLQRARALEAMTMLASQPPVVKRP